MNAAAGRELVLASHTPAPVACCDGMSGAGQGAFFRQTVLSCGEGRSGLRNVDVTEALNSDVQSGPAPWSLGSKAVDQCGHLLLL